MMRARLATVLVALSTLSLLAQGTSNGRFQFEKIADVSAAGPHRLDVDVPLLVGSRPFTVVHRGDRAFASNGLGDLRLFANNVEVPYLLIPPPADEPTFINGKILPVPANDTRENRSSGFEEDLLEAASVDAIDLEGVAAPFLKRFRLEGSGDREHWTLLVGEGTVFDLPAEGVRHTRVEFEAGAYRYLRVTWDDRTSARVMTPGHALVRRVMQSSPRSVLRTAVVVTRRQSEPGRSRFRVTLPGARLPIVALELTVGGGTLLRNARVFEPGLVGSEAQPRLLGQTRLARVVRDEIPAEDLSIPIAQPVEPQIDLVVDDGDNPPLDLTAVTAVFAELPWIYFEAPAAGAIVARYGDMRLAPPRYDLEAARQTITAPANEAAWRGQPPAILTAEPEGLPLPDTGSALSTHGFGFARDIPDGNAGLIVVPLDVKVMGHSGVSPRRLQDLRVVDRAGMQVPYLLERRDEPLIVDVTLERRDLPDGVQRPSTKSTAYAVQSPFSELPNARLVLTTRARVFQRTATLGYVTPTTARQPSRFMTLETKPWVHADEVVSAPALAFAFPERSNGPMFLIVEEGDNQPLPIEKATVMMPSYAVRLFRRPGVSMRLVYGNDRVGAPQYDMNLIAPQLLGRAAEEVPPAAERPLGASGGDSSLELVSPVVFWAALSLTVVVLLGLVVRLMRREAL
jgi:hypothetical protein